MAVEKINLAKHEGVGYVVATETGIDFHRPDGKVTKLSMVDVMESGDAHLQLLFAQFYMGTIQAQASDKMAVAMTALAEALRERNAAADVDPMALVRMVMGNAKEFAREFTMEPSEGGGPQRVVVERPGGNGEGAS